jgi:3-oxoacyl-[acyl-carrier-protein] synthase-1
LKPEDLSSERVACIVGSGVSNTEPIYQAGAKLFSSNGKITPYGVTRSMTSSCSANLVNFYGIKGRSYSISSACATSLHNIGHACELIRADRCDMALAGGADEVSAIMTANFDGMRSALSTAFNNTPQQASRPYDKKRDGFVISGGAGIVIVEELEHARKRNAPIYAEVTGYGASSDGHDIIQPQPQGDGAYRCLIEALEMAHCPVEKIDYINTHGTGTPAGDLAECLAVRRAFGDCKVPISSTKALSGHGIGAAGAQELIYCLLMMKHGFITASVNIEELDPAFMDVAIVRQNRDVTLNRVLTNSFGFGGTNACMIVAKV